MATGWYGSRVIELIKVRSLFVKVLPTPINLSERRAVLRALQRYGDIEVFKRLTEPDTFVCATARADTANNLVHRSPLTFRFMSESLESIQAKSQPIIPPFTVASPILIHEEKQSDEQDWEKVLNTDNEQSDLIKTFTLHIRHSQGHYEHKSIIRRNVLHGPWPKSLEEDQDFVGVALKQVVPNDLAAPGLCDWHTGGQLLEELKHIRSSGESSKNWHVRDRILRRKLRQTSSSGKETLVTWNGVNDFTQRAAQNKKRLTYEDEQ